VMDLLKGIKKDAQKIAPFKNNDRVLELLK
jgi:hypothetical protein